MALGLAHNFDYRPTPRNPLLPIDVGVSYKPTEQERVLAIYACDPQLSIAGACEKAGIAAGTYYKWRSSKAGFKQWFEAYIETYLRNLERYAQEWAHQRGTEILVGIAEDREAPANARIKAVAEMRRIANLKPTRPLVEVVEEKQGQAPGPLRVSTALSAAQRQRHERLANAEPPIAGRVGA